MPARSNRSGSNLTTTREFCEHLTKKRYVHISEFPTILQGEIDGHQCKINPANGLWFGAKDGTNTDNFIENRGGWNCGHELIPVSGASIPKEIRQKFNMHVLGKDFSPEQIANNEEISKKLVLKQGKPMDFEEADKQRGNTNYYKGGQYQKNCQCCVVANELRRRGFDVTALGNPNKKGTTPYSLSEYPAEIWIDPVKNKMPKMDILSSKDNKSLLKDLNTYTQDEGRYHFVYTPKNQRINAHIITIEKLGKDNFQIYDPQDGKSYKFSEFTKNISFSKNIQIYRVDNLLINKEYKLNEIITNRE